jgi:hypothetical protein
MGKKKGDCIHKLSGKCILTEKNCYLKREDLYLCDEFVEYEGKEEELSTEEEEE